MYTNAGKIEAKENHYFSYYLIHKNLEIKAFKNKLDNKTYLSVIDENKQDIINEHIFDDSSYIYKVIFNDDASIMGVLYVKYDEEDYNIKTINLITKNIVEHNDWSEDAYLFDKFLFLYKENELNIYEENNLLQKLENINKLLIQYLKSLKTTKNLLIIFIVKIIIAYIFIKVIKLILI